MKILAINIGETTSWAFYNNKHVTKVVNGRVIYKIAPGETIDAPYRRFYNMLEDARYHRGDGEIDEIHYFHNKDCNSQIICCYKGALSDFRSIYHMDSATMMSKKFIDFVDISIVKKYSDIIMDESDETAIRVLMAAINIRKPKS